LSLCCSEGGFLERKTPTAIATTIATVKDKKDPSVPSTLHPTLPPKMIGYMDDDSVTEQSFELPAYSNELLVGGASVLTSVRKIVKLSDIHLRVLMTFGVRPQLYGCHCIL